MEEKFEFLGAVQARSMRPSSDPVRAVRSVTGAGKFGMSGATAQLFWLICADTSRTQRLPAGEVGLESRIWMAK